MAADERERDHCPTAAGEQVDGLTTQGPDQPVDVIRVHVGRGFHGIVGAHAAVGTARVIGGHRVIGEVAGQGREPGGTHR